MMIRIGLIGSLLLAPAIAVAQTQQAPAVQPAKPGETLTDRLDRTDGVLPPAGNLDPEMTRPAPSGGAMPVLPPPDRASPEQQPPRATGPKK